MIPCLTILVVLWISIEIRIRSNVTPDVYRIPSLICVGDLLAQKVSRVRHRFGIAREREKFDLAVVGQKNRVLFHISAQISASPRKLNINAASQQALNTSLGQGQYSEIHGLRGIKHSQCT